MRDQFDVIVIGFGPTGATLANLLGLSGISTLLLDREYQSCSLPRAVHFDGEVMRVFQTIGISASLAERLLVNAGMQFVSKDTGTLLLDWPRPQEIGDQGWYASYRFHQPELEYELHENLKRFPSVEVRPGCEVHEIQDLEDFAQVTYKNLESGEHHTASAKYVVGCEGARSLTRKKVCESTENAIEDFGYNQSWLVVDLILNQPKPELSDYTIQYCHPRNPVTSAKGPGLRRRWEFALAESERGQSVTEAQVWERLRPWLTQEEAQLERFSVYEFHSVLALKWRRNRFVIAGDAAHQTPPFMGQGMCAGIRDSANLAWKLALILAGKSDPDLLDSYEQERIDHVRSYITTAINLGLLINSKSEQALYEKLNSPDGKMKSIAPKLGTGLASQENSHIGRLFPQPMLTRTRTQPVLLDDHCGYAPALLIKSDLLKELTESQSTELDRFTLAGLAILDSDSEPNIDTALSNLQLRAALIRPDRYILATSNDRDEFNVLIRLLHIVFPVSLASPKIG